MLVKVLVEAYWYKAIIRLGNTEQLSVNTDKLLNEDD